jgi:hypothetical protein
LEPLAPFSSAPENSTIPTIPSGSVGATRRPGCPPSATHAAISGESRQARQQLGLCRPVVAKRAVNDLYDEDRRQLRVSRQLDQRARNTQTGDAVDNGVVLRIEPALVTFDAWPVPLRVVEPDREVDESVGREPGVGQPAQPVQHRGRLHRHARSRVLGCDRRADSRHHAGGGRGVDVYTTEDGDGRAAA